MPKHDSQARKWSKDEVTVLIGSSPPHVREFLRGLHLREVASPEELGLPPGVVAQAMRLFDARAKTPLFEASGPDGRYSVRPEFRRPLTEAFRALPPPAASPFQERVQVAARRRTGPPLSRFEFRLESPGEAADLVGLVHFLNEDVPLGLSFTLAGDGRNFTVEVR